MRFVSLLLICLMALTIQAGPGKRSKSDTLNQTDSDGLKQGHWIFYGKDKPLPDYKLDQIVEEGRYLNNRKDGIWTKYFATGIVQNVITYRNSRPNGLAKIYYPNGNLKEEGIWRGNKWQGSYKYYFEDGSPNYQWDADVYKIYNKGGYGKLSEHYRVLRNASGKVRAKILLNMEGQEMDTVFVSSFSPYTPDLEKGIITKWYEMPLYYNGKERDIFLTEWKGN